MILNRMGHEFGNPKNVVLRPTKTVVKKRSPQAQSREKPRVRVSANAKLRDFYKQRQDGSVDSFTPVANNKNPSMSECFQLRLYRSATGVFVPKEFR